MSGEKTLRMRSFPFLFCCLAILLMASACGKSTVDDRIMGNWKLIVYGYGGPALPRPLNLGSEVLTLRYDHTYETKYRDTLISSGTYHVGHEENPPQSILYFSGQKDYGSWIVFNKDTLVLTYAGVTTTLYAPLVSKYVKM